MSAEDIKGSLQVWGTKAFHTASRIGERLLFPDRNKADFKEFIEEVEKRDAEHLSFQKDLDEELECRPTFEQLDQERILDESNKNIQVMKSLGEILQDRMQSYNHFLTTLGKTKHSFEGFQYCDGTIRQALDALFVYVEKELQTSRQQLVGSEWKKALSDLRHDAERKLSDYQRELIAVEKDYHSAEKKLMKSKETLEKLYEHKLTVEVNEGELTSPRPGRYGRDLRSDKVKMAEEEINKCEKVINDDVRHVLQALRTRDQVYAASRKAYQKLNLECKAAVSDTLKKLIAREREAAMERESALLKLENTVNSIDLESDITDFITTHKNEGSPLILLSQALCTLSDVIPVEGPPSPSPNPIAVATPTKENPSMPTAYASSSSVQASTTKTKMEDTPLVADINNHLNIIFYSRQFDDSTEDELPRELQQDVNQFLRRRNSLVSNFSNAVKTLSNIVETQYGRTAFVGVLNQFRSKKVDIGEGFTALGQVLSHTLDICLDTNDVHTAKIIMMLSQTFYRKIETKDNDEHDQKSSLFPPDKDEEEDRGGKREYLKEMLSPHALWHKSDCKFWEQALWQLIVEQLQTIPYDKVWHDMERVDMTIAVRRVHNVIFSQVMAITHSMIELGCTKTKTREFLYRMCVIHQLGESQRQELLTHLCSM